MRKLLFAVLAFFAVNAGAAIVGPIPNNLTNGTTIDAVPVMANYNWIMNQVNTNAAPIANPTFTGTVTGGAGGFVGALTGNVAGNASTCTAAGITNDTTTNATMYPVWVTGNTGTLPVKTTSTKLTWNPSTGSLGATTFVGALTGNVTGNVSGSSGSTTGNAATATNFNNGTSSSSGGTVTATTFSGALSGNASTATTAGTVTTAAQPAITSVGALTGGSIGSGFGAINIGSNSLTAGAISGTTGTFSGGGTDKVAILTSTAGAYATFQKGITDKGYIGLGLGGAGATTDSMVVRGVADVQIAAGSSTIVSTFSSTGLAVTGTTSSTSFADSGGHLIISSTAPTIASGFGTSPSILANNTAAFRVTVGTAISTTYSGTLTMPAAPNGWVCNVQNVSTPTISSRQVASSTTSVSISDFNSSTNALVQWLTGDVLLFQCTAF